MKKIPFNHFNDFYLNHKSGVDSVSGNVFASGKYIRDAHTALLEVNLAKLCGREYAVVTGSCTDALFFAMKAAGVRAGDEVIVPAFSYIASLSPVLMCNAVPVFADICPDNLMIDPDQIEKLISPKTRAILVVQLFGSMLNVAPIREIADKHNLVIIEDAAQALGAQRCGLPGGKSGDVSCISFDPTKIVSAFATGGVVLTDNSEIFREVKQLIHHGRNSSDEYISLGYNSKMSEISAALINLQLDVLDETLAAYRRVASAYFERLKDNSLILAITPGTEVNPTFHKFVIACEHRDSLRKHLADHGIETRVHYNTLLNEHKLLCGFNHRTGKLPVSDVMKNKVLSLPIYPGLGSDELDYICDCIAKWQF